MTYEESSIEDIINRRGYRKEIKGDKFSLYISNYPVNAKYLKTRLGNPNLVLAELCCSIGVSLEYLAPGFKQLIGVDLDQDALDMCQANLKAAGLSHKTTLLQGDVFDDRILDSIKADIVMYDIPYWYPHKQENKGDLIMKNPPLRDLVEKIRKYITPNIVIFSPPDWGYDYFKRELGRVEFEQVFIHQRHNRNQVYLGDLIQSAGQTRIMLGNSDESTN